MEKEVEVYQEQLNCLQDQLMEAMVKNQDLESQLKIYKDKGIIEKLKIEVEAERKRYRKLEKKLSVVEAKAAREHHLRVHGHDMVEPALDGSKMADFESKQSTKKKQWKFLSSLWTKIIQLGYDAMDDFQPLPKKENGDEDDDGPALTVKLLKENIGRFSDAAKPYFNTIKGIQEVLEWKSPAYTFLIFLVYCFSVWNGCLLSLMLLCIAIRLFVSLLNHIGLKIQFNFFEVIEEKDLKEEEKSLSEKINLVVYVARKVQNVLGSLADSLEKIKSLLTWRHSATKKLFFAMLLGSIFSLFGDIDHMAKYIGIMMGIKVFFINYLYNKYPRLQHKYDSVHRLWISLPTDKQYQEDSIKTELDKYVLVGSDASMSDIQAVTKMDVTSQDKEFCELFSLPPSEAPQLGWKGGRRCTLINKNKALQKRMKSGKLYLTQSFLCFKRKGLLEKKGKIENILIPLSDIINLEKCKPFAFLPGEGMALAITVKGDKTFTIGGLLNRDEAYDHIYQAGLDANLPWATGVVMAADADSKSTSSSASGGTQLRRRNSGQKLSRNFQLATEFEDSDE